MDKRGNPLLWAHDIPIPGQGRPRGDPRRRDLLRPTDQRPSLTSVLRKRNLISRAAMRTPKRSMAATAAFPCRTCCASSSSPMNSTACACSCRTTSPLESRVLIRRNVVERVERVGYAVPLLSTTTCISSPTGIITHAHHRRLHQFGELSLQRGLPRFGRRFPQSQLPAEFGEGCRRRLQWIGDILRLCARRPRSSGPTARCCPACSKTAARCLASHPPSHPLP